MVDALIPSRPFGRAILSLVGACLIALGTGAVAAQDAAGDGTGAPAENAAGDAGPAPSATGRPYRLAPGDVLRVAVVGEPDLATDAPIEMDGTVWFPLIGPIDAGGRTLSEVRTATAQAYLNESLVRPVEAGGGLSSRIETKQVLVTVASYRPIYVTGDIPLPREIAYRPGLTLRHVLALANEVETAEGRAPVVAEEIEASATGLAHAYARIWRLKSLLGTATDADLDRVRVPGAVGVDDLIAIESAILDETRAVLDAERSRLAAEKARQEQRIEVLTKQQANEQEGLQMDMEEVANLRDLFERGLIPATRLAEVRRAALVTNSRALEVDVALETARAQAAKAETDKLQAETALKLDAMDQLTGVLAEVQERRGNLAAIRARAEGGVAEAVTPGTRTPVIFRDGERLSAGMTDPAMPVLPGDIVDVERTDSSESLGGGI